MKNISKKQREVYDYLLNRSQNGPPPSVREIGAAVGLSSPSSVQSILDVLEDAGYIRRDPMLKRSIHLSAQSENVTQVPLLGTIAAGQPIFADENIECYIPYSGKVSSDKSLFALHVRGDSMRDAGILDGDIVVVDKTSVASNREKVVALISNGPDEGATVKTYFKEGRQIRLQPANDDHEEFIRDVDEVTIMGKVVGLIRYYH